MIERVDARERIKRAAEIYGVMDTSTMDSVPSDRAIAESIFNADKPFHPDENVPFSMRLCDNPTLMILVAEDFDAVNKSNVRQTMLNKVFQGKLDPNSIYLSVGPSRFIRIS